MELETLLKQLQRIRPSETYSAISRRAILASPQNKKPLFRFASFLFANMQSAGAIALTSVLLVLIFGGFSLFKTLNPLRLSSLDPTSLHAEADAIDMQIQLSGVSYDPSRLEETTRRSSPRGTELGVENPGIEPTPIITTSSASTTTLPSVESALEMLSN